ncbi:outer membrane protein assembly factor BamA, partial [bacterium]|nr:outer membrane protein assembly factor BamA [bacterium]
MKRTTLRLLLVCATLLPLTALAQPVDGPVTIGLNIDYKTPQEYTLGPIRVEGADNYDHNAIRLIAGLRQGSQITLPGEKITKAVKNLWGEGIFSDV